MVSATWHNALSVATVYRWLGAYTRSGHDLRALIPAVRARGGADASRLRTEVETLAITTIQDKYKVQEKVTIDDVQHELAVRLVEENRVRAPQDQLVLPSRATLARRIATSNLSQEQSQRRSQRTAKQRRHPIRPNTVSRLAVGTGRNRPHPYGSHRHR